MGTNAKFRDLAIRTLIGEAARGDTDSMISVAHVIKNRADSGAYGDASQGGGGRTILAPKQFSMWNADIPSSGKTISPNDPLYQRAGAIVDGVFSGQIPDNTGGADHYYAPGGMPGGRAPSWAIGQTPTATIGGQHFYKLGLSASDATNFGHTSAPAIGTPAPAAAPPLAAAPDAAKPAMASAITSALTSAKSMLGKNEVPDHDEIMSYLHGGGQDLDPHKSAWCAAFVSASLQKAGLPVPTQVVKDSAFGAGALAGSYKTYGSAVDPANTQAGDILVANDGSHVGFAEGPVRQGPNGPEVQMIAGNEKDVSGKYTPGSYTNPTTGAVANRAQVGMVGERWVPLSQYSVRRYTPTDTTGAPAAAPGQGGIGSDAAKPLGTAPAGTSPAVSTIVPNPNVPAANAQPVSATAPTSAAAPGSDKYSVLQGMTTGTGRNPMLYTAANFGNLFGGSAPSVPVPPAAAPAAAPSSQPASAPAAAPATTPAAVPINRNTPLPWQGPAMGPAMPTPWQRNTTDTNNPLPWQGSSASAPVSIPISSGGRPIRIDDNTASTPAPAPVSAPVSAPASVSAPVPAPASAPGTKPWDRPISAPPAPIVPPDAPPPPQTAHPWDLPISSNQPAQLPGSMFASAQNLIKYLFPSATG